MNRFGFFVAIGIFCTAIDIALMQGLIFLGFSYFLAASVGFIAGLLFNFVLHTRVTFGESYSRGALARFLTVVLLNYAITLVCVWLLEISIGQALVGKLVSLPLVAINGYVLCKRWVYK